MSADTTQIIDGLNAAVDFTMDAVSYKCFFSSMAVEFTRTTNSRITFCSNNWEIAINAMKSIRFVCTGFLGKATAAAKFGLHFLTDPYPAIVATFDTGCTVGFIATITRDAGSIGAGANSGRTLEGRNKGDDVAVAWVISTM